MTRPTRRQSALFSVALIIAAGIVGSWSYRNLVASSGPRTVAPTTSTSTSTTVPLDAHALLVYIDDNFSEASWYHSILGYELVGTDGVALLTRLRRDEIEPATAICRAASFWRPGDDLRVVVRAADGATLAESPRGVGADHCRPVPGG